MDVSVSAHSLAEAVLRLDPPPAEALWLHAGTQGEPPAVLRYRTPRGYTREWRVTGATVHQDGNVGLVAQDLARITQGGPIDTGLLRLRTEGKHALWADHNEDGARYRLDAIDARSPDPVTTRKERPSWTGRTADLLRALDETTSRAHGWIRMEATGEGQLTIEGRDGRTHATRTVHGSTNGTHWHWARLVPVMEARSCVTWLDGMQVHLWVDPSPRRVIVDSYARGRFELEAKVVSPRGIVAAQVPLDRIEVSSLALWRMDGAEVGIGDVQWELAGTQLHRGESRVDVKRERAEPLQWKCPPGVLGEAAGAQTANIEPTVLALYPDRIEVEHQYEVEAQVVVPSP